MTPVREFRVLRTFLMVIAVSVPLVTGGAAWITARAVEAELYDEARHYATEVATNVYRRVRTEFLDPLVERGEIVDFESRRDQLESLQRIVSSATYGHRVERLYFFDVHGTIGFSTVTEHIGASMPEGNRSFEEALRGHVSSIVRSRTSPLDISVLPGTKPLLETYVPVRSLDESGAEPVVGVVEVYQEIDKLEELARSSRIRIAWVALASMGILGVLFAGITIRADRVISSRGKQLVETNSKLEDLSRDLEVTVRERTRQLFEQEKLAGLGTLAAGVAHEINNPLATIGACAEGARERLDGEVAVELPVVRRYLDLIVEEVFRCKRITSSLLDFSRSTSAADRASVDIGPLIRDSVELIRLGLRSNRVEIETTIDEGLPRVSCVPGEIRQVLLNIVSNAIDAVESESAPRILIRAYSSEGSLVVECEDNGPGISDDLRDKVFEPFFTTKPAGSGTGLGLAVCYGIAVRHGGRMEIAPLQGSSSADDRARGARVRLVLPAESADS
jgi:signal transduction histidine kinase